MSQYQAFIGEGDMMDKVRLMQSFGYEAKPGPRPWVTPEYVAEFRAKRKQEREEARRRVSMLPNLPTLIEEDAA